MSNVDNHLVLLKSGSDSVVLDFDLVAIGKGIDVLGGGRGEKSDRRLARQTGFSDGDVAMKELLVVIALLVCGLSSCQSVPAERNNHCACQWEGASGLPRAAWV
ncbi:hypothetical protein U8C40_29580 (plasmid) [Sinorhizobium medicae]|nr:hypothetical protein U8C40_29580 [Sinorhizobium medicae]